MTAFWSVATNALNGALFILVGLELRAASRGLTSDDLTDALIAVGVVSVVLVAVRLPFLLVTVGLIRLLDHHPAQRLRRVGHRSRVVGALCGVRGAVSLALALSVPTALDSGAPFPDRDTIIFVTSGVIVVTLVVQSLALPPVVRWADLPHDTPLEFLRAGSEGAGPEEDPALRRGAHDTALRVSRTEFTE
ncbi:cation:proton antiporter [Streptomyces sp. NPDC051064]|uniref:cation:proton antiporter domain-containing protein n=1 Tax=Streptomyces sp. NPDC051064 TaxID=3365641 RepID=UPI003794AD90